ncbi:MAG: phenylalanine--tRNA ligase subunit beta [bacterium]
MFLSYNWLKEFIEIKLPAEKLAELLTMHSFEIDKIRKTETQIEGVIVGQIKKTRKHPELSKLQIVLVNVGKKNLEIVCGAANIKVGQKVPVAQAGTKLPNNIVISDRVIGGVKSAGTLCTARELKLGEDHSGIMILSNSLKVGESLGLVLGLEDVIFEVDNKSLTHRPDLWGHYGVAREIAALTKAKLKPLTFKARIPTKIKIEPDNHKDVLDVVVEDFKLCPRYLGVALDNIRVELSPLWLSQRLESLGVRPVNNIVDLTNYVMLEVGQPMHAFDLNKVLNKKLFESIAKIVARKARRGERIVTLDKKTRILESEMLVIADSESPIALAGIMGGINSEIDENSKVIILESANFNPLNIRQTSAKLGLRTEASMRFEKGLDPNLAEIALKRALILLFKLLPQARIVSKIRDKSRKFKNLRDKKKFSLNVKPIKIESRIINQKIGVELKEKEIKESLARLGFKVSRRGRQLAVTPPTWRATGDIVIAEDVIEEVARIYGYNKINSFLPAIKLEVPKISSSLRFEREVKDILFERLGMSEVSNYSFFSAEQIVKLGYRPTKFLRLANPVSKEAEYLRFNLLGNLLLNINSNLRFSSEFRIFEIGSIFKKETSNYLRSKTSKKRLPKQIKTVVAAIVDEALNSKGAPHFYQVKGMAEYLLKHFGINDYQLDEKKVNKEFWHPSRALTVIINNEKVGTFGEIHPKILERFDIYTRVGAFELNLEKLIKFHQEEKKYEPFSRFPAIVRDLSFIIDKKILYNDIMASIQKNNPLIKKLILFDVYQSAKIGANKKSLTFHFIYQSNERTLKAEEVEEIQLKVIKMLREKFGAEVRVK